MNNDLLHPFERQIAEVIASQCLLRKNAPVLVALSGGADSVALLSALVALGYDCIAAHCNFHLRGDESVRDMRHAQSVAGKLKVNIYIAEFDVYSHIKKTGQSIEMACRELRYNWFHSLLDKDYSQAIAVAHHRADNIETFFLNLLRASGLAGLTGMEYRNGYVVRPMLDVFRSEIENYLVDKGLDFVVDSTNAQNDFKRNKLRNIVLPELERNFPGAMNSIHHVMSHLRDSQLIVEKFIDNISANIIDEQGNINVRKITDTYSDKRLAKTILFEILKNKGLNASQSADIFRATLNDSTGIHFDITDSMKAELDRGILSFHKKQNESGQNQALTYTVSLLHDILNPVNIEVNNCHILEFKPEKNSNTMYLDVKALEDNPVFTIRRFMAGDKLKPYGMKGEKLVSDILKDAKFSAAQKRNTWFLTRNDKILWIIGLRASSLFTVTPKTTRFLKLTYKP